MPPRVNILVLQEIRVTSVLSLWPKKEPKKALRNRNARDASYAQAAENGSRLLSASARRFLNAASLPLRTPPSIPRIGALVQTIDGSLATIQDDFFDPALKAVSIIKNCHRGVPHNKTIP